MKNKLLLNLMAEKHPKTSWHEGNTRLEKSVVLRGNSWLATSSNEEAVCEYDAERLKLSLCKG